MPQVGLATISPQAIFRTGSEMPKKYSTKRPKKRNATRMTKTQTPVFRAVRWRSLDVQEDVMVKKMGIPPKGSTMGNNARNVPAAECGSARRNCRRAWVAFMSTGIPPALPPRAPALPPVRSTAAAPAPHPLYRSLRSLPESLLPHSPCIRPERRSHGETTDDAAILRAPAALAPHCAAPGSILLDLAADSSVSGESLPPHPENVLRSQSRHSGQICVRRICCPLSS